MAAEVTKAMSARSRPKARKTGLSEERRATPRFPLLMRTAKLLCESGEYVCIVHDVSSGGARIGLFHEFPSDRHLFIELANGERYAMERRWHCERQAGFRFASPIDVNEFIEEPSRHARRPLRVRLQKPALVTAGGRDNRAMLVDISQQGACIEAGRELSEGEECRLETHGLPVRFGRICWRSDHRHGLVFHRAFRLEDFARHMFALHAHDPASMPQSVDNRAIEVRYG